jgi:CheY-like chemotaxis protein
MTKGKVSSKGTSKAADVKKVAPKKSSKTSKAGSSSKSTKKASATKSSNANKSIVSKEVQEKKPVKKPEEDRALCIFLDGKDKMISLWEEVFSIEMEDRKFHFFCEYYDLMKFMTAASFDKAVVITGYLMSVKSGAALAQEIKAKFPGKNVKTIIFTNLFLNKEIKAAMEKGAVDKFYTKCDPNAMGYIRDYINEFDPD